MCPSWISHLIFKKDIMNNDTKAVASGDRLSKSTAMVFPDFFLGVE